MESSYILIERKELINLLESAYLGEALEYGGVDNWEGYSISIDNFLEDLNVEDFDQLVEDTMKNFENYNKKILNE